MFVLFPVGVALVLVAVVSIPWPARWPRRRGFPLAADAGRTGVFAWAGLSILWTPFPIPAAQRLLKIAMTGARRDGGDRHARDHLRATDLYLFPIGVLMLMVTIFALWFAAQQTLALDAGRIDEGGIAMAMLLFPAMGGLAARGRNGYARTADAARPRLRLRHRLEARSPRRCSPASRRCPSPSPTSNGRCATSAGRRSR